ncbi:MAG: hypothetical protein IT314_12170 [Anaerolineales bacterium]|nr:hypothetical protein [Anaerolineales bacterium]
MKIIKNEKLIKRNSRIGQWTTVAALLILGGGMFFSISDPSNPERVVYSIVALGVGFILTQIGLYFGNRWGRSPRPDEQLDAGLKGLPGDFVIYHYATPASHLLVGPAGVWVLLPYRQRGAVTFSKNRWRVGGGGFLQAYMSVFGQEGIGRPDLEAENEIGAIKKMLAQGFGESELPSVNVALIFTHDQAEVNAQDAPLPALKLKQLKDFMRQKAKQVKMPPHVLEKIKTVIGQ